jgi:hypothetical protein
MVASEAANSAARATMVGDPGFFDFKVSFLAQVRLTAMNHPPASLVPESLANSRHFEALPTLAELLWRRTKMAAFLLEL